MRNAPIVSFVALKDIETGFQILEATENSIDTDEYFFNPGWFSSNEIKIFEWEFTTYTFKSRSFFTGDRIVGGFIAQISPSLIVRKRSIYNFLDFLGDVGGLREAFNQLGAVFLYFFGARGLHGYLVSSIFFIENTDETEKS